MRCCPNGGYLVTAKSAPSTDPVDHDASTLALRGCNRLRCQRCHAFVRTAADLASGVGTAAEHEELYAAADLTTSRLAGPYPGARLYVCKCSHWKILIEDAALDEPSADRDSYPPTVPWRCAGHPVAELPHEFDGVLVTPENVRELVARALKGWVPEGAYPADKAGALWIARLHVRLAESPWASAVADAVTASLDDPQTWPRALQFLLLFPTAEGTRRSLDILAGDAQRFAGVPDPVTTVPGDTTIEDSLWRIVIPAVASDPRARELARATALEPGKGRMAVYVALAAHDSEWLAARVEEVARATPDRATDLAAAIKYRFPRTISVKQTLEKITAFLPRKS